MRSLRALADVWQAEANDCDHRMEQMELADEVDEEAYAYLRGRRDGFETCAIEAREELEAAKERKSKPKD